jgi:hypothetical protein
MTSSMRRMVAGLVVCLAAVNATSQEKSAAKVERPIETLAWLTGGVWTADATKLGPGMLRIETRYQWSDNGSYIRFTTHFVSDKATMKTYDGNFYWNPEKKGLEMWYMDARNHITAGPVKMDGATEQMFFEGQDFEGKDALLRVDVVKKSPDLYTWTLLEKHGDGWKQLASLDYVRKTEM